MRKSVDINKEVQIKASKGRWTFNPVSRVIPDKKKSKIEKEKFKSEMKIY